MTDLFDIRFWIYPGGNPQADASLWGLEVDVSSKVRHPGGDGGQVISYSGGKGDEASSVDAGQMSLTLDNRDGRFSTDKIDGPYYGLLDLNTPARLGVVAWTDSFTRSLSSQWGTVDATLSQSWSLSGTASWWSVDGARGQVLIPTANTAVVAQALNSNSRDVDVTMLVVPSATATGASYGAGTIVRRTDNSNMIYSTLEFNTAGTLTVKIRSVVAAAAAVEIGVLNPIPVLTYSAGQVWKLRTQADGNQIRVKVWLASGSEPATWHATGTESTNQGTQCGIYAARFTGNTNSAVANLVGVDDFTVIANEFTGTVVSWPLRWDKSGNNSWAPITVAGVLRRLQQGTNPVQSPLRRQLASTADVVGYWPLEDGASATYFTSTIPRQAPATFNSAVTPAADATLAGGGNAPSFSAATGVITGSVARGNGGTGFAAMFLCKLTSLPGTKTRIARFRTSRGIVPIYDISIDSVSFYTEGLDASGTVITSATNALPAVDFTQWVAWQLETDNTLPSAGNTTWTTILHQVGQASYYFHTANLVGGNNSIISSFALTGPSGTAFAHVWLGGNTLPFVTDAFSLVSSGYAGELAAARFARVCSEAGIPCIVRTVSTSEAMGAQREGSTLSILRACADADYGVMAERGAGLEFIGREARWNAAVTMAVTVAAGQIDQAPEPVRDDQRLRNRWTVSRVNGGSGSAQDDTSVARNGTWEDSVTLNVKDDTVLDNHAGFRVAIGTARAMRWPRVALNFGRNRTLLPSWRARGYGWRLTIGTLLTQVSGNEPDLVVEGFSCSLWPNGWEAELNASSATVWKAAVADDTGIYGRIDAEGCTTTALVSATATSIPITTASPFPKWDNTAGLWSGGVDLNLGGERITVTSIANNADPAQTLTVSARGVGGYAASHASGTSVSLWDPAVVAL